MADVSFMTVCRIIKALEMAAEKYAVGEHEINELIYRGYNGGFTTMILMSQ